jgi:hypothetical protein
VRAGQRYNAFQAVQLANRTGALNEIEFSEFVAKAQPLPMPWARWSCPTCCTRWAGASWTSSPASTMRS